MPPSSSPHPVPNPRCSSFVFNQDPLTSAFPINWPGASSLPPMLPLGAFEMSRMAFRSHRFERFFPAPAADSGKALSCSVPPASAPDIAALADRLRQGDTRALARALSLVENDAPEAPALLSACFPQAGKALRIG